jgi:signal transduction histidine kinase
VVLLEKRFERGGTFATDDYSTPFLYNLAQFELPLGAELPPYRDLELQACGIRLIEPEHAFSVQAEPRGEELVIGRGGRGLGPEVEEMFAAVSAAVTPLLYDAPRDEEDALADVLKAAATLAAETPATLARRAGDPRAAVALRYACGLAGFLDGDARLGLVGGFAVARLFSPTIVVGGTKNLANALAREAASTVRSDGHVVEIEGVDTVVANGDPSRLQRVLTNLIANAVKYSATGSRVAVRIARQDGAAVVTIADEGRGIPPTDMPYIFERFRRGSNVEGISGTGIGLTAAKQIIELHGGTIGVESTEGVGSTFTVRLPL